MRPRGASESRGVGWAVSQRGAFTDRVPQTQSAADPDCHVLFPAETRPATTMTSRPCHGTATTGKLSRGQGPPSTTSSTCASLCLHSPARVRGSRGAEGVGSLGGGWGRNGSLRRCIPLCDASGLANKRPEDSFKGLNDQFPGWSSESVLKPSHYRLCEHEEVEVGGSNHGGR